LKNPWLIKIILITAVLFALSSPDHRGEARVLLQEGEEEGPVYIVQEGDSLWDIAYRFRVPLEDLTRVNGITDPSQLSVGARLIIPGLEGIQGVLTTQNIPYGENLLSLSRRYKIPIELLIKLNHLTSPGELFSGSTLVIPEQYTQPVSISRDLITPGQSLLEIAVLTGKNPWTYVIENDLAGTWSAVPGDVLQVTSKDISPQDDVPGALPPTITSVQINPTKISQGKVVTIIITGHEGMKLGGSLVAHDLHFSSEKEGELISLQGIHAMTEPGLYSLVISGTLPAEAPYYNAPFSFSQSVVTGSGNYPFDPVLVVSPETIDPAVTFPEDAQWATLASPYNPEKLWEGIFSSPAPDIYKDCWPSLFGNRRSYNGSAYTYFHSGLDFCGGVGTEIRAPAAGRIVFAGPLTVRGNATLIDHGWGIYSGYLHQSEINVKPGDLVQPGQVIGLVGGTGRVTGPHLHWEIWAGGVQVNPMDWLEEIYPY